LRNLPDYERIYFNTPLIKHDARFCLAESYYYLKKYSSAEKIYLDLAKLNSGVSEMFTPAYIERKLTIIREIKANSTIFKSEADEKTFKE
jgi:hypothetical protein